MRYKSTNTHCSTCKCELTEQTRAGQWCEKCSRARYKTSAKALAWNQNRVNTPAYIAWQLARVKSKGLDPRPYLLKEAQRRALKKGIECTIALEDIIIPDLCPLLGIQLLPGTKADKKASPSIDRVDNNKGYTPDNIRVISFLANAMKHTASPEHLLAFAKNIEAYLTP